MIDFSPISTESLTTTLPSPPQIGTDLEFSFNETPTVAFHNAKMTPQMSHLVGGGTGIAQNPLNWRPIGLRQNITTTISDKINNTLGKLHIKVMETVLMTKPKKMDEKEENNSERKEVFLELPKKETHCLGRF